MHCKQCGRQIDEDSIFCRFCGTQQSRLEVASVPAKLPATEPEPVDKSLQVAMWGGGILFLLIVIVVLSTADNSPARPDSEPLDTMDAIAESIGDTNMAMAAEEPAKEVPQPNWSYSTDEDKVRGSTSYYARTTSTNSIFQSSPYDGQTTMDMLVREREGRGSDVLLIISSGQMMCPSYEGCEGTVRFDDGPAEPVSFDGPADNSSETIFVSDADDFIAKLKKSKKVVIEKTLYQAGNPQFEFNVEGLKWEH